MRTFLRSPLTAVLALGLAVPGACAAAPAAGEPMNAAVPLVSPWLHLPGAEGPGKGKKIVLIAGDQEYRSEEVLPQLARILSQRHGFDCTVLFCVDPQDGTVNPNIPNIPGLSQLKDADLVLFFTRWLDLPDPQVKAILDYADSGRPMIGIRTSTHTFKLSSPTYRQWTWDSKEPGYEGGFGRLVFGETWYTHHGEHGKQGTRGIFAPGSEGHPILRGIQRGSIFGPTDVYGVRLPLPGENQHLVLGEVTESLEPNSPPVPAKNTPMMPIAWTRTYRGPSGRAARVFTSTLGASTDFAYEGTRRLLVNAVYWALGMERQIPARSNVDLVGEYHPTMFRFKNAADFRPGKLPSEY